jgi:hypothetical protein
MGFRYIPYMGVIHVVAEAAKLGFYNGHPDWCNLGQGQPEVGEMAGAPDRYSTFELEPGDHAYGPIGGSDTLRTAIAGHYNRLYRQGKESQYTANNISVVSGGRLALTRVMASLSDGKLGYQIPDYTAYEELITAHMHRIEPVMIPVTLEDRFIVTPERLEEVLLKKDLTAFLCSNPCNPTGGIVRGEDLKEYVRISQRHRLVLLLDEFYSHFIYNEDGGPGNGPVSAAEYVEDVNRDPVILIDGLTKCFRYPGWRLGWIVGPEEAIEMINRGASAIDGGPSQPVQRAALDVLNEERMEKETNALRKVFSEKRKVMLSALDEMGIVVGGHASGTFYVWADLSQLPEKINTGERFFREALKRRVMTVPGRFFDVNPAGKRTGLSPYTQWMRFSYGPDRQNLEKGLERLKEMVEEARQRD